ncbi:DUF4870 domain-containing protein [soil metagenome]
MENSGKSAFGLDPNVAAGLAYIPVCLCHFIVSIGIIATDKTNKLPRFHAFQSLLLSALIIVSYIITFVLAMVIILIASALNLPALSILSFLVYLVFLLVVLGVVVGLVISCIKAFQGQIFKLPIIGNLADKWSN